MIGFRHLSLVPTVPHTFNDAPKPLFHGDDVHHATKGEYLGSARLGGRIIDVGGDLLLFFRGNVKNDAARKYQGAFCWRHTGAPSFSEGYKQQDYTPTNSGEALFDIKDLTFGWQHAEARVGNLSIHVTHDGGSVHTALFTFKVKEDHYFDGFTRLRLKETNPSSPYFPVLAEASWNGTSATFNDMPGAVKKQFKVQKRSSSGKWRNIGGKDWDWFGPTIAKGDTNTAKGSITIRNAGSDAIEVRIIRRRTRFHCAATMKYDSSNNRWSDFRFLGPIVTSAGNVDSFGTLSFFRKPKGNKLFAVSPGSKEEGRSEKVVVYQTKISKLNNSLTALRSSDLSTPDGSAFSWEDGFDLGVAIDNGETYDVDDVKHYGMGHKVQSSFFDDRDGYGYAVVTGGNTKEKATGRPSNDYPSYGKIYRVNLNASEADIGSGLAWEEYPYGISFMRACIDSPGGGGIWGPQIFRENGEYYAIAEHVGALMNSGTVKHPIWVAASNAHPDQYGNPLRPSELDDLRLYEYGGRLGYNKEITSNSLMMKMELPAFARRLSDAWPLSLPFPNSTSIHIQNCQDNSYLTVGSGKGVKAGLQMPSLPTEAHTFQIHQHGDFFRITCGQWDDNGFLAEPDRYSGRTLNETSPPLKLAYEPEEKERTFVHLIRRPDMDVADSEDIWPAFQILWAGTSRQLFNDASKGVVCGPQRKGTDGNRGCWYLKPA